MLVLQSDLPRPTATAAFCHLSPISSDARHHPLASLHTPAPISPPPVRLRAVPAGAPSFVEKATEKPPICTADELHYVSVPNSNWRLAVWRYLPSPQAPQRNHPLLLLSGVGANAIGYDLSPGSSFARYMSRQGFDTWILEVRGTGLSTEVRSGHVKLSVNGLIEARKSSTIASQLSNLSRRLMNIIEGSKQSVFIDLQEHFSTTIGDFQKQLDLIANYDWDFDHYLEEDVPSAMEYIKTQCKPKDGKMLAIGHSMGGILLYAMLSRDVWKGRDSDLTSVITLASSLDYTTSKSSLKLLLPLADTVQAVNVPVVPMGAMLAAAYPLASRPPYVLSWLHPQISAQNMMHPKLFEKLVLNNFCTVPAKVLLQLRTAFREGGLCDRSGNFFYKDHLRKSNVPILAVAGDQDLICPPEAVYEAIKLIPEHLITYKVYGEPGSPHYAHYDLVGGRLAADQLYPSIIEFLSRHDKA